MCARYATPPPCTCFATWPAWTTWLRNHRPINRIAGINAFAQRCEKLVSGFAVALAERIGWDEFCVGINSNKHPSVSEFRWVVVAHIASDNVQGGAQAGKLMCAGLPKGTGAVAIIDEPEVTSVQDRVKGFKQALAQNCANAKIVADISGGGERAKASSVMEDLLQSHKDLKGVFGINDDSALGAAKAIQAAGLSGKIVVVGYDATPEAQSAIKNGQMYGDAIQHPDQIGSITIETIHDYFGGKTPPKKIAVDVGQFTKADAK